MRRAERLPPSPVWRAAPPIDFEPATGRLYPFGDRFYHPRDAGSSAGIRSVIRLIDRSDSGE